jgi:hypothetical protein
LLQFEEECGLQFVIPNKLFILRATGHFSEWRENAVTASSPHMPLIILKEPMIALALVVVLGLF